ncbi:hypothetical protein H5410_003190 [Solanum commersonii]|uniref:At2g35280-like TPR domain-containing protein n=1 Tax=Solanum commersonii TaxID=4109 RepID=A0A9J6B442_SOLCO|nr:hypothetical protein H5410_003190 [Solanum commersonii]
MLNDEFDVVDMNSHDVEIGKDEVLDFESNNPQTPIVGSNIPCSSQSSRVNNIRDDETGFYKGMTFKIKEELANSLKIACLKKDFRLKKVVSHFYKEAKAYDRCEFNDHFNQIRDLVPKAAKTLERIGFHTWSRAFCPRNRYNIMTSNIAESVNSMFDVEREFPICALFDEINRRFALLFHQRRMELVNSANRFVLSIEKDISKEKYLLHKLIQANLEEGDIRDAVKLKITRIKKNYIESLPRELLIDIVEMTVSYSLKDLMRVKLRVLNQVANEPSVYQKKCVEHRGIYKPYTEKALIFFNCNDPTALGMINQAADIGHIGASYVLAIISIFNGGESMRESLMFIANMKRTEPLKFRRCRHQL